jgi:UDP-GlcNAc3NAcA epimerase
VHRAENTDSEERMRGITDALREMSSPSCPTVLPLHPRTRNCLETLGLLQALENNTAIRLIPPIGFCDMVMLEKHAATILTDSGGIQKEAYFHHTPCITLRKETEWVETVDAGWNQIAGYNTSDILRCLETHPEKKEITEYGTGNASKDIVDLL